MSNISEMPVPKGLAARLRILSNTLRTAIETPTALGYGGDDGTLGGADVRPGVWEPPATITADDLVSARRWMQLYQQDAGTVQSGVLHKWLMTLLLGVANAGNEQEIELRIKALMLALDDRSASCFTRDTLRAAQARFQFVPTAKELIEFCDGLEAAEREAARRIMRVLDIGERSGEKRDRQGRDFRWSKEEAEAHARDLYEIKARERRDMLRAIGVVPVPIPPSMPGEAEKAYVSRLNAFAKEIMRDAALDQKRRMEARLRAAHPMPPPSAPPSPSEDTDASPVPPAARSED